MPICWRRRAKFQVRKAGVTALVAISTLLLSGCGTSSIANNSDTGFISGNGATVLVSPQERGEVIELAGETLDGQPLDIADWRGAPVVINLWASWCGPCIKEYPALRNAYSQFKEDGFEIVSV